MTLPFANSYYLSALASNHKNSDRITELACSLSKRSTKRTIHYQVYDENNSFLVPESQVGRLGSPKTIEYSGTQRVAMMTDHGLTTRLAKMDIDESFDKSELLKNKTIWLTNSLLLNQELELKNLINDPSSYDPNLVQDVLPDNSLDNPDSDPELLINEMLDKAQIRPNTLVMGLDVFRALKRHPKIRSLASINPNASVDTRDLAELFEVENIAVGKTKIVEHINHTGAPNSMWSDKNLIGTYVDPNFESLDTPVHIACWQLGQIEASVEHDIISGGKGGVFELKVASSWKFELISKTSGVLLTNIIS